MTIINQRLRDKYLQKIAYDILVCEANFECEPSLFLLPSKLRKILMKFRTTDHHLSFVILRWKTVERSKPYCTLCHCNKIGDELHVILLCKTLSKLRNQFYNYI